MATNVIMPALELVQETGTLIRWLISEGQSVTKGEPLMEIETDKVTVEIEATASGVLAGVRAAPGEEIPVGEVIAVILAEGEKPPERLAGNIDETVDSSQQLNVSPVAARIAKEHGIDLTLLRPESGRIKKADVLSYIAGSSLGNAPASLDIGDANGVNVPASPKARRVASEHGLEVADLAGSGPAKAVLVADVLTAVGDHPPTPSAEPAALSTVWRVMAQRVTQSWTTVPHFYLLREVHASKFFDWREQAQTRQKQKLTHSDLLVKLVAVALSSHPRVNATWKDDGITLNTEINVGLAVAVADGLIVPVIRKADTLGLSRIAAFRKDLTERAQAGELQPMDVCGGTFTVSNLGMYGVDAFNAIVNPPQAAILTVGRITERVVPVNGQPGIELMMTLGISCDHRVVDGATGAEFLQTLAGMIEDPSGILD